MGLVLPRVYWESIFLSECLLAVSLLLEEVVLETGSVRGVPMW